MSERDELLEDLFTGDAGEKKITPPDQRQGSGSFAEMLKADGYEHIPAWEDLQRLHKEDAEREANPAPSRKKSRFDKNTKTLEEILADFPRHRLMTEEEIANADKTRAEERIQEAIKPHLEAFYNGLPEDYLRMAKEGLPQTPGNREGRKIASKLPKGEHLFIYGDPGITKTALALAAARFQIERNGLTARYALFEDILDNMRPVANGQVDRRINWLAPDVLIVDEIDKSADTDYTYSKLLQLTQRLNHKKTTIFVSNHDPLKTGLMYGRRNQQNQKAIVSRFARCAPIEVTGADYRPQERILSWN